MELSRAVHFRKTNAKFHGLNLPGNLPGISLTFIIGLLANALGKDLPLIGGAVLAIVIGVLLRHFFSIPTLFIEGVNYTQKKLLKLAIILLGFSFSFSSIIGVGLNAIIVIFIAVFMGIFLTYIISKLFRLEGSIPLLISLGTAICGATAIATTGPIIKAKEEDIVYAINTIFAFNVLAVLIYPLIGKLLNLPDDLFGLWAGTAIHDTSSVVAAGYIYSDAAGDSSIIVKLIRTLMLVPIAVILSFYISIKKSRENTKKNVKIINIFPFFILIFAGAATINSIFPLPLGFVTFTSFIAKFLIIMVMASVGLGTDIRKIKSLGVRPLLVGLISSFVMGLVSVILILFLY